MPSCFRKWLNLFWRITHIWELFSQIYVKDLCSTLLVFVLSKDLLLTTALFFVGVLWPAQEACCFLWQCWCLSLLELDPPGSWANSIRWNLSWCKMFTTLFTSGTLNLERRSFRLEATSTISCEHVVSLCSLTWVHNHFLLLFLVAGPTSCWGFTLWRIWADWRAAGCPPWTLPLTWRSVTAAG